MKITEQKVRLWNDQRLRALVTVVFDDCFVVRNIKVIQGRDDKLFVAMPSRKLPDNTYVDIAHPITMEFREYLEATILGAYEHELDLRDQDPEKYSQDSRESRGRDQDDQGDWAPGR